MATHPKADPGGRYIAHKTDSGWVVDFGRLSASGDAFLVVDEAIQTGNSPKFQVKTFDPARKDTGWNLSGARAIEAASRDFGEVNRPYNIAVLPAGNESLYVYLYPAQVDNGIYPLGGDVRYRISADGTRIMAKRQMHKGIVEYGPVSSSEKESAGYHTHVLSDVPEDTDVFLVLTRQPRVPEVVVTPSYMYSISVNGTITVADRPSVK
jgi:hypothetical protein